MRTPRTIFWMNNMKSGAENLCELDDPRQTCVAMNAGEFKSDAEAERLGIKQYLYGGGAEAQARTARGEGRDAQAMSAESAKGSQAVRESQKEHEQLRPMSVEERAYVENAVVSGAPVSAEERSVAGQMGAEWTGPSPAEITAAGGDYQTAAEKAAQAQGLTGEPPKPGDAPKPDEPKLPDVESSRRTTPPRNP